MLYYINQSISWKEKYFFFALSTSAYKFMHHYLKLLLRKTRYKIIIKMVWKIQLLHKGLLKIRYKYYDYYIFHLLYKLF